MTDIVEVMRAAVAAAVIALFLGTLAFLAVLVRLLAPAGGLDQMPIPPGGVPERAAAVSARIRAHVRDRWALPAEVPPSAVEPARLQLLVQRHSALLRREAAA
ncbi:MAG TPA: hypothetical protein VFH98_09200 [Candidatus Limnocylindria bacterium]|jgi:hypothetical protein|nr:hypothetical protein [Candidatus Limnocylindria bacterium]